MEGGRGEWEGAGCRPAYVSKNKDTGNRGMLKRRKKFCMSYEDEDLIPRVTRAMEGLSIEDRIRSRKFFSGFCVENRLEGGQRRHRKTSCLLKDDNLKYRSGCREKWAAPCALLRTVVGQTYNQARDESRTRAGFPYWTAEWLVTPFVKKDTPAALLGLISLWTCCVRGAHGPFRERRRAVHDKCS